MTRADFACTVDLYRKVKQILNGVEFDQIGMTADDYFEVQHSVDIVFEISVTDNISTDQTLARPLQLADHFNAETSSLFRPFNLRSQLHEKLLKQDIKASQRSHEQSEVVPAVPK